MQRRGFLQAAAAPRVTARIHRTAEGQLLREYCVRGVAYSSAEALEAALDHGGRHEPV
jgi:hypothetical protein